MKLIIWTLITAICIDLSLGFVVKHSNSHWAETLNNYFEYGASTESKVRKDIGNDDQHAENIAKAGWFVPRKKQTDSTNKKTVIVYGMSFSNHIANQLRKLDSNLNIEEYAGPGSPLNHSYAYIQFHRPFNKGEIVILGILASSLVKMNTLTAMTCDFESPAMHFYPEYSLDKNGKLISHEIPIHTLDQLRTDFDSPKKWRSVKQKLKEYDKFYYPLIFNSGITDNSIYAKLIKRALAQKHKKQVIAKYHNKNGFTNADQLSKVTKYLVKKFAIDVRKDGAKPYVILFNDRSYGSDLYKLLSMTLKQNKIPFYSTHKDFPASNLANFLPDGHFTPKIDHEIAIKVLAHIKSIE